MRKIFLATIFMAGMLCATDFTSMSTQDLLNLRGTVSAENQASFRNELQSRVSTMTTEERESLGAAQNSTNSYNGNGYGLTSRDGTGTGSMGASSGGFGGGVGGHGGRRR